MYVCMYLCMYVCMYVCMCVYVLLARLASKAKAGFGGAVSLDKIEEPNPSLRFDKLIFWPVGPVCFSVYSSRRTRPLSDSEARELPLGDMCV